MRVSYAKHELHSEPPSSILRKPEVYLCIQHRRQGKNDHLPPSPVFCAGWEHQLQTSDCPLSPELQHPVFKNTSPQHVCGQSTCSVGTSLFPQWSLSIQDRKRAATKGVALRRRRSGRKHVDLTTSLCPEIRLLWRSGRPIPGLHKCWWGLVFLPLTVPKL